jgi:hypothetical protein
VNIPEEIRKWVALGVVIVVLCLAFAVLTMCSNRNRDDNRTQVATGKALDRVATQEPKIRDDQEEKQRAVDEIEGADQPLPDGFAGDLQRLRDRSANPR